MSIRRTKFGLDFMGASNCPSIYPFGAVVVSNTPEEFQKSLKITKESMAAREGAGLPMVTITAWNEWTEGSYLEPDTRHGLGYLEAVRDVRPMTGDAFRHLCTTNFPPIRQ